MPGLWKNREGTTEGKYLVMRRDGTIPEWPGFVMGAGDPAAPVALRAYAARAMQLGMDDDYVDDVYRLADEFEEWRAEHGAGDPDAAPHREDDPEVIEKMRQGRGA